MLAVVLDVCMFVFFFKQKTAYEMRISVWSSDVCSSDLQTAFYQRYRKLLDACLRHRWLVIGVTVLAFVLSIALFRFVPQQFFPDSVRPELMVDKIGRASCRERVCQYV